MSVRSFIIVTLGFIILYLVLIRNPRLFASLITKTSDMFGKSFQAVTSVGNFGQQAQGS